MLENVSLDRAVAKTLKARLEHTLASGFDLRPAGKARRRRDGFLLERYPPLFALELYGLTIYLSGLREYEGFTFFVAYVQMPRGHGRGSRKIFPRIFYKDVSLIWRSATHYINTNDEHWIGKGDIKPVVEDGKEVWYSAEETTNLPLEIQAALDTASRRSPRSVADADALGLVLRNAPANRVEPYQDFAAPREAAMRDASLVINNGKPIAWFETSDDPSSLKFTKGFEPDFVDGLIDESESSSYFYGGDILKSRFMSVNRKIHYMIVSAPEHVWLIPPQSTLASLTSYGVRPIDVEIDERVCLPGYDFHFLDTELDPPELHSQIPAGFAGDPNPVDADRADTKRWNEAMPVVAEFRHWLATRR